MAKANKKRILNIIVNVLLAAFLVICIFSVFVNLLAKRDSDGAVEVFGYQLRIVVSNSMAESEFTDVSDYKIKDIPVRSLVVVKVMPDDPAEADEWYRDLQVGDVLTFRYVDTTQVTITHRIVSITEKETGGFIIELAGDNKTSDDGQLTQIIDTSISDNTNYVIGEVTSTSYLLGVIMSVLATPLGIIFIIIIPCFAIILYEILKITKIMTAEKKRDRDEEKEKDKELELLRRKVAELENAKAAQAEAQAAQETAHDEAQAAQETAHDGEEKAE